MVKEHIAIVSQDPYPDPRVEREAFTLIKHGYKVTFIGKINKQPCLILGEKSHNFNCVNVEFHRLAYSLLEPGLSKTVNKVQRVLNSIKPDIVIAVNPIAGYVVDKLGIPLVIDNHEYFYMLIKCYPLFGTKVMSLSKRLIYLLGTLRRRWLYRIKLIEADLASKHPMIFTNSYAKKDFSKRFNINENNLFILKNYPSRTEAREIHEIAVNNKITFGYIGLDLPARSRCRDLSITAEVLCDLSKQYDFRVLVAGINHKQLCFQGIGWLDMHSLYKLFSTIDFGLATWTPHPLHQFFNPNKPYQYAIVGSVPIVTSTLKSIVDDMPRDAIVIRAYDKDTFRDELRSVFEELLALNADERIRLRERIMQYARRKLVWENQEHVLLDSIKNAS